MDPLAMLSGGAGGIDISNPAYATSRAGNVNGITGSFNTSKGVSNKTIIVLALGMGALWAIMK